MRQSVDVWGRGPGAKRPGLPPQRSGSAPRRASRRAQRVCLSPITSAGSPRPLETTGTHGEGGRWQPAPHSTTATPDPASLATRAVPGVRAGAEPSGTGRGATTGTLNLTAPPRIGLPGTPQKLSARREKLPAAGPRRPPYLEVAPHVLGHGVIVDVEREGELGVGLQRRRRHQHHAAGVHLPSGCGTAGRFGTAVGGGTRGWERWWCGTRSPAAASSSPISSAGISRWVTSTTSLRVSSCRHSTGMGHLPCWFLPQRPREPRPGAQGWAGQHSDTGCTCIIRVLPPGLHIFTCFILSFSASARLRASSFLCKQSSHAESHWGETLRHHGTLGCHCLLSNISRVFTPKRHCPHQMGHGGGGRVARGGAHSLRISLCPLRTDHAAEWQKVPWTPWDVTDPTSP